MSALTDQELLSRVREAMSIGLPACRAEFAKAKAEGREPSSIAVEALPFWEMVEKTIDEDPDGLVKAIRELKSLPGSSGQDTAVLPPAPC